MNSRITIVFIVDNNSKQLYSQFNEDTPICFMRTYVRDVLRVDTFQLIYKGRVITNDMLTLKQIINVDDNNTNVVFHINSKCKCERKAFTTVNNKCGSCKQYRNAINELRNSNDVLKEVNAKLKMDIALTVNNVDNINDTHYKYLYYKYRELYFQEKQAKENIIHHHQLQNNNTYINSYINVLILNCVLPFLSKNDIVNMSVTSKYICEKCLMYVMNYIHKTQLHLTHDKQWNISLYNKSFSQGNRFQLSNSTLKCLRKASNDNVMKINEATFYNNTNVLKLFKVFYTFRRKLLEVNVNDNSFVNAVINELQQGIQCNNGDIVKYLLNEIEMFDFTYNTINDIIAVRNKHNDDNVFNIDKINTSTPCNLVEIISLIINEAFIYCGIANDNTNNNVTQRSNIIKDITHLNTTYNKYNTIQTKLNTLIHRIFPELPLLNIYN